jgi:hypothetical protein
VCGQETTQDEYFQLTTANIVSSLGWQWLPDHVLRISSPDRMIVTCYHCLGSRLTRCCCLQVRDLLAPQPCSSVLMAYGISAAGKTFTIEVRPSPHCRPAGRVQAARKCQRQLCSNDLI